MHQLNLPAVTIGDLELSFRFAIEDTCELFEEKSEDEIKALDVIVDAEQLAELPESAIHNITLKVSQCCGRVRFLLPTSSPMLLIRLI